VAENDIEAGLAEAEAPSPPSDVEPDRDRQLSDLRDAVAATNSSVNQLAQTLGQAAAPKPPPERDWFGDEEIQKAQDEGRLGEHLRRGLDSWGRRYREENIAPIETHGLGAVEAITRRMRASKTDDDRIPELEAKLERELRGLTPAQRANPDIVDQVEALVYGSQDARRMRDQKLERRIREQIALEAREGRLEIDGVTPPAARTKKDEGPSPNDLFREGLITPEAKRELNRLAQRGELDEWASTGLNRPLGCRNFRDWARLRGYVDVED